MTLTGQALGASRNDERGHEGRTRLPTNGPSVGTRTPHAGHTGLHIIVSRVGRATRISLGGTPNA